MTRGVIKFKMEKFNDNNLSLLKVKVMDLLVQNDQALALKWIAHQSSSMKDESEKGWT